MGLHQFANDSVTGYGAYPAFASTAPKLSEITHSPSEPTKKSIKQRPANPARRPEIRTTYTPLILTNKSIKKRPWSPTASPRTRLSHSPSTSTRRSINQGPASTANSLGTTLTHTSSVSTRKSTRQRPESPATNLGTRLSHSSSPSINWGQDLIDSLDDTADPYHHDGPYDPANPALNKKGLSPIEAFGTTEHSHACGSQTKHIEHRYIPSQPLHPPGTMDSEGRISQFEAGTNIMCDTMRESAVVSFLPPLLPVVAKGSN